VADVEAPVTVLLRAWRSGDKAALDALMPVVYEELHRLATAYVARERPGRTLSPTDLVSEAYGRFAMDANQPDWSDRTHFFAVAARLMRQILVDRARKRGAGKRGGGEEPVTFDDGTIAVSSSDELIALDEALTALTAVDERKARAIEMHYFAGMTHEEIASVLEISISTVQRELRVAESWLYNQLRAP
jgi:RNA polymerase sigma factor (TIGR02999 family)